MKNRIVSMLLAAGAIVAGAHAQSDDCSAPQPIAGSGAFSFNLEGLAPSQGVPNGCFQHQTPIRDGWYCWTADCTGTVTISTCGDPLVDTALALYGADNGCACPGDIPPICCGDDVCGKQARIECTVECGRRYLIRIGVKPSPVFTGTLLIECNGKPCGGSNEPVGCDRCCGRPPLVDNLPTPFDPGLVAASTNYDAFSGSPALYLVDLGGQGSAPAGSNWNTDRYSHPSWTMQNLGGIFGVTLDGVGNVYVAHASAYPDYTATGDPVGFAGPGAIYRIDGTTGAATSVIALPQQVDPAQQVGQQYAGIGQLTWGCATRRLYASNMEDGRIYSIDPADVSGFKVKSTYRHGGAVTGALADGSLADPGDAPGFEPLGTRIWAVKVAGNRLYYSIWSRARPVSRVCPTRSGRSASMARANSSPPRGSSSSMFRSAPERTTRIPSRTSPSTRTAACSWRSARCSTTRTRVRTMRA